jgi:hypothetical protein
MNGDSGGFDWGAAVMVGNDIAQQWYSLITQKPLPTRQEGVAVDLPGLHGTAGTTTLIVVGAVIVAVVLLLKK